MKLIYVLFYRELEKQTKSNRKQLKKVREKIEDSESEGELGDDVISGEAGGR